MLWCLLSLATALSVSTGDALTKKFFGRFSPCEMAIAASLYSLPFLVVTFPLVPVPVLDHVFWWMFCLLVPLDAVAFYLYMKAIKLSPLSLSVPFLSFTPVFMVFTGFVMLGEVPNLWGGVGIFLVVAGSYTLHASELKNGYLAPFGAVFKETGSLLMLVVAILFSIMAVMGKMAIQHSSALFFGFSFLSTLDVVILVTFPLFGKIHWRPLMRIPFQGLCVGLMLYLHVLLHTLAISMVEAIYMISVKRTSILFSVIYGWLLFKETDLGTRFLGALLMFVGVVCITLLG